MITRDKLNSKSGIYQIVSIVNNRIYIGSSCNLSIRKSQHFKKLKNNKHPNSHLQNHCNKYGIEDLEFHLIECCSKEKLIEREQYWIDTLSPEFNRCKIAGPFMAGDNHPKFFKGKNFSTAHKDALKNAHADFSGKNHPSFGKHYKQYNQKPLEQRKAKPIDQYDIEGNYIKSFNNCRTASIHLNIPYEKLRQCVVGGNKTAGGFIWVYKGTFIEEKLIKHKFVSQFDLQGNFVKKYINAKEASSSTGISYIVVCKIIRDKIDYGTQWIFTHGESPYLKEIGVKTRTIFQFDLNGNLIKQYANVKEVCDCIKLSSSAVYSILNHNGKPKYGKEYILTKNSKF
jgi:group I intron endonuclease